MSKKFRLTKFVASLESEDGTAVVVDAKDVTAELEEPITDSSEATGGKEGETATAPQEADAGGKDFTAMDKASERQGEAIHKQMERLDEACVATEEYVKLLRGSRRHGLESATAAVISHDLKAMYPKFFQKLTTSLEAIDDEASGPARIGQTKEAETEASGRLGKLKGAVVEAWKKFIAWLGERWAKFKALYEKIFSRTKKVKEANTKLLSNPGAAAEVKAMLGAPVREATPEKMDDAKPAATPNKEPRGKVTVPNIGILSGDDPLDMKQVNLKVMTDVYEKWMKPTEASVNAVLKLMLGDESKQAQMIDMSEVANEIVRVEYTPMSGNLPGNYVLEATDNKWGFKLVQHDQPETITEVDALDPTAVKRILATNDSTLDIALDMGEAWVRIQGVVEKITHETSFIMNIGKAAELKKYITEYLTTLTNSDMVPLTKLMVQACTARLLLCTEMSEGKK